MKLFEIWMEGYLVTGMEGTSAPAHKLASIEAESFKEACILFSQTERAKGRGDFNEKNLSFWGCKLFNSEAKARRSFG